MQTVPTESDILATFDVKVEAYKAEREGVTYLHEQTAGQGVPTGPRIRRREVWVDVHPEEYPGFKFRMQTNYESGLLMDVLRAGQGETVQQIEESTERSIAALNQIVVEHNGWLTERGELFPPANTPEFWGPIMPTELAQTIIAQIQVKTRELPNSVLMQRRR